MAGSRSFSIKQKLTVTTMAVSVIVLLLASVGFISYDTKNFRAGMIRELSTFAKVIGNNASAALVFQDEKSGLEILSALSAKEHIMAAALYEPDGTVLALYHRGGTVFTPPSPEAEGYRFSDSALVLFQKVVMAEGTEDKTVGTLYLESDLEELSSRRTYLFLSILVLAVLMGMGNLISLYIVRRITMPLEQMTNVAVKMASGDFTQKIDSTANDEIGILANAFSGMATSLKGMIKKIQDASQHIIALSGQLSEISKNVGEGSVHQAKSTENTSVSIEEMNATVRNISENADSVSLSAQSTASALGEMSVAIRQVAESAGALSSSVEDTTSSVMQMSGSIRSVAENINALSVSSNETAASVAEVNASIKGVEENAKKSARLTEKVSGDAQELSAGAMQQAIKGMEKIRNTVDQSSEVINKLDGRAKRIGKILTVIEEITRQTNLLALNASILAAQAGQEGKGFGIVAEEIKNLANRTADSTKEINQLIIDVQSEAKGAVVSAQEGTRSVIEGSRLLINAKESLNKILESSKLSSDTSRQIEMATLEQAKSTTRVAELMEKVNIMIGQIDTAMRELRSGTEHVSDASERMKTITGQVKVSTQEQARGSGQINNDVENVTSRIQQIAGAMNEQKKGNQLIMKSVDEIREIAQISAQMMQSMNESVNGLIEQADLLEAEVNRFKV
jgi:methyl-accepting chemotaxis protein